MFALRVRECVAAALATLALSGQSLDSPPRPVSNGGDNRSASPLRGVWREIGSGRIIAIGENGFDLYHETSILCYRDEGVLGGYPLALQKAVELIRTTIPKDAR